MMRASRILLTGVALPVTTALWAAQAPDDQPLGDLGLTDLQQATGNAVQSTCIGFIDNEDAETPVQQALFATCGTMVRTGNQILSGEPVDGSLDQNQVQLSASLQQLATEEFANTESVANEIATNRQDPVITRLAAIRGNVTGFSVTGLVPDNSDLLAEADWLEAGQPLRGGGAGDDGPGSALSGFLNVGFGTGKRDATTSTNGFDYDAFNVTLGLDYRFTSNFVVGGALNYYQVDSAFDQAPTVAGGDLDTKGWGGTLFGTYYGQSFYVDALVGYAVSDYDIERNILIASNNPDVDSILETAEASTDSRDYALSIGAGGSFGRGGFGWGPYGRLTYTAVDIDGYQEKGAEGSGLNLDVEKQEWTSLISALGFQISHTFSQNYGVIVPQGRFGWIHQFDNDAQEFIATYTADPRQFALVATTDDPDRDYFELGLGISTVFKGGSQLFLNYDTLLGFENLTSHLLTLGGRLEF